MGEPIIKAPENKSESILTFLKENAGKPIEGQMLYDLWYSLGQDTPAIPIGASGTTEGTVHELSSLKILKDNLGVLRMEAGSINPANERFDIVTYSEASEMIKNSEELIQKAIEALKKDLTTLSAAGANLNDLVK